MTGEDPKDKRPKKALSDKAKAKLAKDAAESLALKKAKIIKEAEAIGQIKVLLLDFNRAQQCSILNQLGAGCEFIGKFSAPWMDNRPSSGRQSNGQFELQSTPPQASQYAKREVKPKTDSTKAKSGGKGDASGTKVPVKEAALKAAKQRALQALHSYKKEKGIGQKDQLDPADPVQLAWVKARDELRTYLDSRFTSLPKRDRILLLKHEAARRARKERSEAKKNSKETKSSDQASASAGDFIANNEEMLVSDDTASQSGSGLTSVRNATKTLSLNPTKGKNQK